MLVAIFVKIIIYMIVKSDALKWNQMQEWGEKNFY